MSATKSWSLALACTLLAGCQAASPGSRPALTFALGLEGATPGQAVPVVQQGAATGTGTLRIRLDALGLKAERRLLSTLADIDHLLVTIKPADGASITRTIPKADLTNATFVDITGIPVGQALVTVSAFDATGRSLGSSAKSAWVEANQTVAVSTTIQLAPSYTAGSGGGGSSAPTGDLSLTVAVVDGVEVPLDAQPGTVLKSIDTGYTGNALAVDADHFTWMTGYRLNPTTFMMEGRLMKFSAMGALVGDYALEGMPDDIAIDGNGDLWVVLDSNAAGDMAILRIGRDGVVKERHPSAPALKTVAVDGQNRPWVTNALNRTIEVLGVTGNSFESGAHDVAIDSNDNGWVLGSRLIHQTANNFPLDEIDFGYTGPTGTPFNGSVAVDKADRVWTITDDHKLRQFSPSGALLQAVDGFGTPGVNVLSSSSQQVVSDGQGGVWARKATSLVHFAADGTVEPELAIPNADLAGGLAMGTTGVWVTSGTKLYLLAR